MGTADIILEFDGVTVAGVAHDRGAIEDMSLVLEAGQVVLVRPEDSGEPPPLGDLAIGLLDPDSGCVRFHGESWREMGAHRGGACRRRVRRIFDSDGWVTNLDVMENILLAEMYHGGRSMEELAMEADRHARFFGLAGVPDTRPAWSPTVLLRKLEWVRALMGEPELIAIDRFHGSIPRADAARLVEAIHAAAVRGAAVLWVTDDAAVRDHVLLSGVRRYGLRGTRMEPDMGMGS